MSNIVKYFKSLSERQHPLFIVSLLLLSFVGSNIYYFVTFNYINKLQNSGIFIKPDTQQNMAFATKMINLARESSPDTSLEVEVNDPMVVCKYWRGQVEKDNSWTNRLEANEECVNAILDYLSKIDSHDIKQGTN